MKGMGRSIVGLMLLLTGWWSAAVAGSAPLSLVEKHLWELAVKAQMEQERTITVLHDPVLDALLQHVTTNLWAHVVTDLPPAVVRVVQEAALDAHAYPNGVIYLTTGMLAHVRSQDQLAMIIAHEIVHYTERHALRFLKRLDAPYRASAMVIDQSFQKKSFAAEENSADFYEDFEQQADCEGLALMHAAGYCIGEVLPLLRSFKHQAVSQDHDSDWVVEADVMGERIERMRQLVEGMSDKPSGANACGISPTALQAFRVSKASALLANTRSAIRKGHWVVGAENIHRYLNLVPHDPLAHYLRGEIQRRSMQNKDLALDAYQKAIRLDHSFAPAYRAIGVIHFKAGRLEQARHYFETSLVMAPADDESEYIRGYIQLCRE